MEIAVASLLDARGLTLGLAESVTGGLLGARLTAAPGASTWFRGSIVSYASEVKYDLLGVPEGPVVSGPSAEAMALGARKVLGADVGLAVTGVAGPAGQEGIAARHGVRRPRAGRRGRVPRGAPAGRPSAGAGVLGDHRARPAAPPPPRTGRHARDRTGDGPPGVGDAGAAARVGLLRPGAGRGVRQARAQGLLDGLRRLAGRADGSGRPGRGGGDVRRLPPVADPPRACPTRGTWPPRRRSSRTRLEAASRALTRLLDGPPSGGEVEVVGDLLLDALERADPVGRPIFAAHLALDRPEDPDRPGVARGHRVPRAPRRRARRRARPPRA